MLVFGPQAQLQVWKRHGIPTQMPSSCLDSSTTGKPHFGPWPLAFLRIIQNDLKLWQATLARKVLIPREGCGHMGKVNSRWVPYDWILLLSHFCVGVFMFVWLYVLTEARGQLQVSLLWQRPAWVLSPHFYLFVCMSVCVHMCSEVRVQLVRANSLFLPLGFWESNSGSQA